MGGVILTIFAGVGFFIWVVILYFLTRKKADPTYQTLQSILFILVTAHIIFAFHSTSEKFYEKELALFAFPIPLLLGKIPKDFPPLFLNTILFFSIVAGATAFHFISKKTKNIYHRIVVSTLIFYTIAFVTGDILFNNALAESAKKSGMECYIKNSTFAESVLHLNYYSHAEAEKNGEVYRWSYKNMGFYKTGYKPNWPFGCRFKEGKIVLR
jgi:hypothetical protein